MSAQISLAAVAVTLSLVVATSALHAQPADGAPPSPASGAPPSPADGAPSPPAAAGAGSKTPAEELFHRGLREMLAGRYSSGCPALAESYKMDPLPGALFTLAECEAGWGRIGSALGHYQQYLSQFERMAAEGQARQAERAEVARSKVAELSERVPRLKLSFAGDMPAGTVIRRDGAQLPVTLLGVAVPVDPGEHTIVAEAPGRTTKTLSVTILDGEQRNVVIDLVPAAVPPPPSSGPDGDTMRTAAYVTGGVGLASLIGSFVAGGVTLGHKSTIDDNCQGLMCNAEGLNAAADASTTGTIADVTFTVGLVAVGAALVVYLLAPASSDPTGADPTGAPAVEAAVNVLPSADIAVVRDPLGGAHPRLSLGLVGNW